MKYSAKNVLFLLGKIPIRFLREKELLSSINFRSLFCQNLMG